MGDLSHGLMGDKLILDLEVLGLDLDILSPLTASVIAPDNFLIF